MYKGHPWEAEAFGRFEYECCLETGRALNLGFDVKLNPFLDFCKENGHCPHQLTMKTAASLSANHLPQYMIGNNGRPCPVKYPAGYSRHGSKRLLNIAVDIQKGFFRELIVAEKTESHQLWISKKLARLSSYFTKHHPYCRDDYYALLVMRNPLVNLKRPVTILGSHVQTMGLVVPFGEKVTCTFFAPNAFGNASFFEPFLLEFKTYMEEP